MSATEIKDDLSRHRVNVSTSTRSSAVLDMDRRHLDEVVRASVHYYNTDEELEAFVGHIERLAAPQSG